MLTRSGFAFAALLCVGTISNALAQDTRDYAIYAGDEPRTLQAMVQDLSGADVVFVGENHDDKQAHALELAILQELDRQNPALTFSLEMFERDVQGVLDEYLHGYITETQFLQASRPWQNYRSDYRPLIEFCKEHQIPVVAANAPRRYVNIVSRKGAAALLELPRSSQVYLTPLPYSMDLPPGYEKQLDEVLGNHDADVKKQEATGNKGTPGTKPADAKETAPPPAMAMPSVANMKQAQGLWDATMADSLLKAVRTYRGRKIMQINGSMHSDSGYGIVARLRKAAPHLKIMIVSIKPDDTLATAPHEKYAGVADFVILTRPSAEQVSEK